MTAEADRSWQRPDAASLWKRARSLLKAGRERMGRALSWLADHLPFRNGFSSLTRRIVVLNLIGLAILVSGILYLNQFRAGLIDAKVQSLLTQGEIIARAIAASAGVDTDEVQLDPEKLLEAEQGTAGADNDALPNSLEFAIDPERAAPILRPLVKPTGSRARVYNGDGALILDSDTFYSRGEVLRYDLPAPAAEEPDTLTRFWQSVKTRMRQYDLPLYTEIGGANGMAYPEVATALTGTSVPIVRINEKGEMVVSVAVPIQRMRAVLGVLLLSTRGGDIDNIVAAERWGIVQGVAVRRRHHHRSLGDPRQHHCRSCAAAFGRRRARAPQRQGPRRDPGFHRPHRRDRPSFRRAARHDQRAIQADRRHRELCRRRGA